MRFEISLLLNAAVVLVEIAALYFLLNGLLEKRILPKPPVFALYSAYFVCALVSSQFIGTMLTNTIISITFPLIISLTIYGGGLWARIISACLSIVYHFLSEPLAAILAQLISGKLIPIPPDWGYTYFIGAAIATAIYLIIAIVFSRRKTIKVSRFGMQNGILMLLMITVCWFLAYEEMAQIIEFGAPVTIMQFLNEFAIAGMAVFIYYVFQRFQKNAEDETTAMLINRQMADIRTQFDLIAEREKEIRTIKHDLSSQLSMLRTISGIDTHPELSEIAKSLSKHIEYIARQVVTGITVIDAIIELKRARAASLDIDFIVKANEARNIVIDPIDLNIVIGNALDNAIEACARLPESSQRYVELAMKNEDDFLYIRITNPSLPP